MTTDLTAWSNMVNDHLDYIENLGYSLRLSALPDERLEAWLTDFDQALELLEMKNPSEARPVMLSIFVFSSAYEHWRKSLRWWNRYSRRTNEKFLEYYRVFLFMLKYLSVARKKGFPIFDDDLFDFNRYPVIKEKYYMLFYSYEIENTTIEALTPKENSVPVS